MSTLHAITGLAGFTLRRLFAGRRWTASALILAAAPVLAFLIVRRAGRPGEVFDAVSVSFATHLPPLLLALIYGNALTTSEIEDGTAGYALLGGLRRATVAVVQVVVTWFGLTVFCAVEVGATLAAAHFSGKTPLPSGTLTHACVYVLAASALLLPVLAGVAFCGYAFRRGIGASVAATVLWEIMVPHMPIKWAAWTLTNNARALILDGVFKGGPAEPLEYAHNWDFPPARDAAIYLGIVAALGLALAGIAAARRNLVRTEAS